MINILEDGRVIGRVMANRNLDYWDGRNHQHGGHGHHLGLTIRKNGDLVLIHTSQWQGESDWAEIVDEDEAMQAILRADAIDLLEEPRFKKLKALYDENFAGADELLGGVEDE